MGLKGLMKAHPPTLSLEASVLEASRVMTEGNVGGLAVTQGRKLRGILTHRDILARVVIPKKDPEKVKVSDVMTRDVVTIIANRSCGDALRLMVERGYSYLPVIDREGSEELAGMLSITDLLEHEIEHLASELDAVTSYFSVDSAGGD